MKIGDIFKSTWGYDQTNVDFYVVTRLTPKMVEIQQCGHKTVGDQTSWASDRVIPDPDRVFGEKFLRRPVTYGSRNDSTYVSIDNVAVASLMSDPTVPTDRSWWA